MSTKFILINSTIPGKEQLIKSIKCSYLEIDIVNTAESIDTFFLSNNSLLNNLSHFAFMYENNDNNISFFPNDNQYFGDLFSYFIEKLVFLNNSIIIDIITCDINKTEQQERLSILESQYNIDIRYSLNKTGSYSLGGDWILESDNMNIKDIYFNDNINDWNYILFGYTDTMILKLDASTLTSANNTALASWTSTVSPSYVASSSSSSNYPVVKTNTLNGYSIVQYLSASGQRQFISNFTLTNIFNFTLFVLYRVPVGYTGHIFMELGSDVNSNNGFYIWSNGNGYSIVKGTPGLGGSTGTSITPTPGTWGLHCLISADPAFSNYTSTYMNGVRISSGTTDLSILSPMSLTATLNINCRADSTTLNFNVDIAEIRMYNSALNQTNRQSVEADIMWKWGLKTTLPGSHPYYSSLGSNTLPTGAVTISGILRQYESLSVISNTISDADGISGPFTYQWYQGTTSGIINTLFSTSTSSTIILNQGNVGSYIRVNISYTDLLYNVETVCSNIVGPITNVEDLPTGSISISGVIVINSLLSLTNTICDIDGISGTLSYQWYQGTTSGTINTLFSTNSTITLGNSQNNNYIQVNVSYTDNYGIFYTVCSNIVGPITDSIILKLDASTLTASNNTALASWTSTVSPSYVASSSSSSNYPVVKTNTLNGYPIVQYLNASAQRQIIPNVALTNIYNFSIFVLYRIPVGYSGYLYIVYGNNDGTTGFVTYSGGNYFSYIQASGVTTGSNATPTPGTWGLHCLISSDPSFSNFTSTYMNGVRLASSSTNLSALAPISMTTTLNINTKADTTTNIMNVEIAEIRIYNSSVNQYARQYIEADIMWKWGLRTTLPISHPYYYSLIPNTLPTGSVTISGILKQNESLSAINTISDVNGISGQLSYYWYRGTTSGTISTLFSTSTSSIIILNNSTVGSYIRVNVSYTDLINNVETVCSNIIGPIANVDDLPTGSITISGVIVINSLLSLRNTICDVDGISGALSYQWYQGTTSGTINTLFSTSSTVTLNSSQVNRYIRVNVSYTDNYDVVNTVCSNIVGPITDTMILKLDASTLTSANNTALANWTSTVAPSYIATSSSSSLYPVVKTNTLNGYPIVEYLNASGQRQIISNFALTNIFNFSLFVLYRVPVGYSGSIFIELGNDANSSTGFYIWSGGGYYSLIQGNGVTTGSNATPTAGTWGLHCLISSDPSFSNFTSTYMNGIRLASNATNLSALAPISFTNTLNINTRGNSTNNVNNVNIAELRIYNSALNLTDRQYIEAEIMWKWGLRTTLPVSHPYYYSLVTNTLPTGSITISGILKQNESLSIISNTISDADGISGLLSYYWYRGTTSGTINTLFSTSTSSTIILNQSTVGSYIRVNVSYTDLISTFETVCSNIVGPIANADDLPTGSINITSIIGQKSILSVINTICDIDGISGALSYQWYQGTTSGTINTLISTSSTVTLNSSYINSYIQVNVSYTDNYGVFNTVCSNIGGPVLANTPPSGSVTVSGILVQNSILSLRNTICDIDGISGPFSYQWYQGTTSGTINTLFSTSGTVTLGTSQNNNYIQVNVSYTDNLGMFTTVFSSIVGPVIDINSNTYLANYYIQTISSLIFRLDASTLNLSNGNSVSSWTGPTAITAIPANNTTPPTYVANGLNNLGYVLFNSGNIYNIPSVVLSHQSIFTLFLLYNPVNHSVNCPFIEYGTNAWPNAGEWYIQTGREAMATGTSPSTVTYNSTVTYIAGYDVGSNITAAQNTWQLLTIVNRGAGGSYIWYTNGVQRYTTGASSGATGPLTRNLYFNGRNSGAPSYSATTLSYNTRVADFMLFRTGLSDTDMKKVEGAIMTKWGLTNLLPVSHPYYISNNPPTGSVTISGILTQNRTLSITNTISDIDGISGSFTYQWSRGTTSLTVNTLFSTSSTINLNQSTVGSYIRVNVSYTDNLGMVNTICSSIVGPIANIDDPTIGSVTLLGGTAQRSTIYILNTICDIDGISGPYTYKWYQGTTSSTINTLISTSSTLTLANSQVNKYIRANISYTDNYGTFNTICSNIIGPILNNNTPTGSVTISGTLAQNKVLSVRNTICDIDGISGSFSYRWYASTSSNIEVVLFSTSSTVTLNMNQINRYIQVNVDYTDNYNNFTTVCSTIVGPVIDLNSYLINYYIRDVSGLLFRLDASTLNLSNGNSVSSWVGSTTYTGVPANNTSPPTYIANGLNNLGIVSFNSGNIYNIPNVVLSYQSIFTLFLLYNPVNHSINCPFIEYGTSAWSNSGEWYIQTGREAMATGTSPATVTYNSTITSVLGYDIGSNITATQNTWQLLTIVNRGSGGNYVWYTNGTQRYTTPASTGITGPLTRNLYFNGRNSGAPSYSATTLSYNTKVADFMLFNAGLSDTDRQKIEGAIMWKWGLTDLLPVSHPYYYINSQPTGTIAISGTPTKLYPLSVINMLNDVDGITEPYLYKWYQGSTSGIINTLISISSEVTLYESQIGQYIRVNVSYTDNYGLFTTVCSNIFGPVVDAFSSVAPLPPNQASYNILINGNVQSVATVSNLVNVSAGTISITTDKTAMTSFSKLNHHYKEGDPIVIMKTEYTAATVSSFITNIKSAVENNVGNIVIERNVNGVNVVSSGTYAQKSTGSLQLSDISNSVQLETNLANTSVSGITNNDLILTSLNPISQTDTTNNVYAKFFFKVIDLSTNEMKSSSYNIPITITLPNFDVVTATLTVKRYNEITRAWDIIGSAYRQGTTNGFTFNFTENSDYIFVKSGSLMGDPHIYTFSGESYDLPNINGKFILFDNLQEDKLIIMCQCKFLDAYELKTSKYMNNYIKTSTFMKKLWICYNNEEMQIDMNTLEIIGAPSKIVIGEVYKDRDVFKHFYSWIKQLKIVFNGCSRMIIIDNKYYIKVSVDLNCADHRNGIEIDGPNLQSGYGALVSSTHNSIIVRY